MRSIKIFLFLFLLLNVIGYGSNPPDAPEKFLKVKGYAYASESNYLKGATILLFKDNQLVERQTAGRKGKFNFDLEKNSYYTIEVQKEGYISKRIRVSTEAPGNVKRAPIYEFRVKLLKPKYFKNAADRSPLDFPAAIIEYNNRRDQFEHDKSYTKKVKQEYKKLKG